MSDRTYKVKLCEEKKYAVQDITDEPVVRVIAAKGKNFEPTIVEELPETGDSSKLYLTPKAHTTQTATGNPITATVAEEAGAIESFQLDGDTYQYSYDGGNLFNTTLESGTISSVTGEDGESATNRLRTVGFIELIGGATTVTAETSSSKTLQFVPRYYSDDGTYLGYGSLSWQTSPKTLNLPRGTKKIRLLFRFSDDTTMSSDQITSISITENPAPNPDYPQPIQTVTGTQTISINGTDYPLDLGNIELCKLGDYHDYIYKDGEDWKVHKATNKVIFDGSESWAQSGTTTDQRQVCYINAVSMQILTGAPRELSLMSGFIFATSDYENGGNFRLYNISSGVVQYLAIAISKDDASSTEEFIEWLGNNPQTFCYPLANPTDTVITDQTLIAQLEAIRTASLQNDTNTITNTATGSNLAGDMEIGYYGFNPTNRYDKWLWLQTGWESLGN